MVLTGVDQELPRFLQAPVRLPLRLVRRLRDIHERGHTDQLRTNGVLQAGPQIEVSQLPIPAPHARGSQVVKRGLDERGGQAIQASVPDLGHHSCHAHAVHLETRRAQGLGVSPVGVPVGQRRHGGRGQRTRDVACPQVGEGSPSLVLRTEAPHDALAVGEGDGGDPFVASLVEVDRSIMVGATWHGGAPYAVVATTLLSYHSSPPGRA
jgi:hypothetical protein